MVLVLQNYKFRNLIHELTPLQMGFIATAINRAVQKTKFGKPSMMETLKQKVRDRWR